MIVFAGKSYVKVRLQSETAEDFSIVRREGAQRF
jgi:hypothetical protein